MKHKQKQRKPIKRSKPLKRSAKPIRKRSKKTEAKYVERRKLVQSVLDRRPYCEAGEALFRASDGKLGHLGDVLSTELHEPLMRSQGGDILDEANVISICWQCHRSTHDHVSVAYEIGLLKRSWDAG